MNMKKIAAIAAAVAIATGVGVYAYANGNAAASQGPFGGRVAKKIAAALHLSDAQKVQMQAIGKDERPLVLPILGDLRAGHDQIEAITDTGSFDRAQIEPIAKEQAAGIVDLIVEAERAKSKACAVLTPSQQAQVTKFTYHAWSRIDSRLKAGLDGRDWMVGFLQDKLDLTDQQTSQIREIVAREKPVARPIVLKLAATARDLKVATAGDTFDETQVRAEAEKSEATIIEAVIEGAKVRAEVMAVLTPEQRERAHDLKQQFRTRADGFIAHGKG